MLDALNGTFGLLNGNPFLLDKMGNSLNVQSADLICDKTPGGRSSRMTAPAGYEATIENSRSIMVLDTRVGCSGVSVKY